LLLRDKGEVPADAELLNLREAAAAVEKAYWEREDLQAADALEKARAGVLPPVTAMLKVNLGGKTAEVPATVSAEAVVWAGRQQAAWLLEDVLSTEGWG